MSLGLTGVSSTLTAHSAFFPPSKVVTVTMALPAAFAVTKPVDETSTASTLVDQVTALFVALSGLTVAVNCLVPPTERVILVWSIETDSTETVLSVLQAASERETAASAIVVNNCFFILFPPFAIFIACKYINNS